MSRIGNKFIVFIMFLLIFLTCLVSEISINNLKEYKNLVAMSLVFMEMIVCLFILLSFKLKEKVEIILFFSGSYVMLGIYSILVIVLAFFHKYLTYNKYIVLNISALIIFIIFVTIFYAISKIKKEGDSSDKYKSFANR